MEANFNLGADVYAALNAGIGTEDALGAEVLRTLVENAELARQEQVRSARISVWWWFLLTSGSGWRSLAAAFPRPSTKACASATSAGFCGNRS